MNEILSKALTQRNLYGKMKKRYTTQVMYEAMNQLTVMAGAIPGDHKYDLDLEWFVKNQKRDPDNIHSGIKFILDGMVLAKVLPNDTQRFIGKISHRISLDADNPRCEVSLTQRPD